MTSKTLSPLGSSTATTTSMDASTMVVAHAATARTTGTMTASRTESDVVCSNRYIPQMSRQRMVISPCLSISATCSDIRTNLVLHLTEARNISSKKD